MEARIGSRNRNKRPTRVVCDVQTASNSAACWIAIRGKSAARPFSIELDPVGCFFSPHNRRGKGKRGGLRVIYYWWDAGFQFWLFTLYDKDEMADLTPQQRKVLKGTIKTELDARRK